MLEYICADVIRGAHNKVEFYILVNQMGMEFEMHPDELKQSIKSGEAVVTNMKLTKEGKLKLIK